MAGTLFASGGLLLLVLSLSSPSEAAAVGSVDTLKPITKISPARRVGDTVDSFGYSVTAHQLFEDPSGMSLEDILNQTLIMVGAPNGAYPGGLDFSEAPLTNLACVQFYFLNGTGVNSLPTNPQQIFECLKLDNPLGEVNRTGLVYQCPLSSGTCTAPLGNGDPRSPDGLLFDRIGNIDTYIYGGLSLDYKDFHFAQDKKGQQMGATVYSEGGFFVACAPLWEFVDVSLSSSQPRGHCVYSGRDLRNFLMLEPCYRRGSPSGQKGEGYCEAGFSVSVSTSPISTGSDSNLTASVVMTGTPGRDFSSGGVFYYSPAGTPSSVVSERVQSTELNVNFYMNTLNNLDISLLGQAAAVNASNGDGDGPVNAPLDAEHNYTYYGFAMASGFLTSRTLKGVAVGAPRRNSATKIQVGGVYIVENAKALSNIIIDGDQFGEQFGYSVATADLNGDGIWDDVLVGAPVYRSDNRQLGETGRVAVYKNLRNGSFAYSTSLLGRANGGRFGMSVASMGDLNNDGYDDFAVGAPFEGDGVIYIYHGQNTNDDCPIVNTTIIQQIINGTQVAAQVTNLTSVSTFGFSLSGSTDVDQNGYRGNLSCSGCFETQTVFVLRSLPVAVTNISFTINVARVRLGSFNCQFGGSIYSACFDVNINSSYIGRGIESGFSTTYVLSEVTSSGQQPRLVFDSSLNSRIRRSIAYNEVDEIVTDSLPVYVKNTTNFENFKLRIQLEQIPRDTSPVDTGLNVTSFSQDPIIQSDYYEREIPVVRNCGDDDVCISDLVLNVSNIIYTSQEGTRYTSISVGIVERVAINVTIDNTGEDSFNPFLTFNLSKQNFAYEPSFAINCTDTTPGDEYTSVFVCSNVLPPLFRSGGSVSHIINLRVLNIRGNETSIRVPISVNNTDETFSREDVNDNNGKDAPLPVMAITTYRTEVQWTPEQLDYKGTGSQFSNNRANTLGSQVNITASVRKTSGVQISRGEFALYIPAFSSETGSNFFFYPVQLINSSSNLMCDESTLNPRGYSLDGVPADVGTTRRRKRSTGGMPYLSLRQSGSQLNCAGSQEAGCIPVRCNFTSLVQQVEIIITGYIDERFFNGKTATYNLTTFMRVNITDGFTITSNESISEAADILSLIGPTDTGTSSTIPWYVIAVPIIAAIIFFIILAVILYFLGFFRRKKHGKAEITGEEEFEQFAPNPFGGGTNAAAAAKQEEAEKS